MLVVAVLASISTVAVAGGPVGPFPDVPNDHPFADNIFWLSHLGITEGYGDGNYRPADPVTRGSMAAFFERNFEATDDQTYAAYESASGATIVSGSTWTQLPGSMIEFSMPAGAGARLLATFTAESLCTGVGGHCSARIMVDDPASGVPGPQELNPTSDGFAFDATEGGTALAGGWGSHSMQRLGNLRGHDGSDTWTAWVEINTTSNNIDFRVDDWTHTLLVDIVGLDT